MVDFDMYLYAALFWDHVEIYHFGTRRGPGVARAQGRIIDFHMLDIWQRPISIAFVCV